MSQPSAADLLNKQATSPVRTPVSQHLVISALSLNILVVGKVRGEKGEEYKL
jgi:hypothetical protein